MPALLIVLFLPQPVQAQSDGDRVKFFRSFEIRPGEQVGDAVCIGCSILVEGVVTGDAVVVGGSIEVSGLVQGDAVSVGSGIELMADGTVSGDCVAIGGSIEGARADQIGGESVSVPLWLVVLPVLLAIGIPLVLLALLVWIIMRLVRRSRRPAVAA